MNPSTNQRAVRSGGAHLDTAPGCLPANVLKVGQASSLSGELTARAFKSPPAAPGNPDSVMLAPARSSDRLEACPASFALPVPGAVRGRARSGAFTLLELMVAITIFVLVVATIYATWILIVRSSQVAQEAAAQAQRERIAIRTVENSLMCIQSFQASMKYYSFDVENGPQPIFSFTSRLPDVFPRNGKFGDFNVRRLVYSVEQGQDQDKNLVLRQTPILMEMDEDEKNVPLVLARNVKDFEIECWDTNAMDWEKEWDYTNIIPPLVRITFAFGSHMPNGLDGPVVTLSRVIALPCSTAPQILQMPHR